MKTIEDVDMSQCRKGLHPYIAIYNGRYDGMGADVVRWCPVCGCVVIDKDCDNRVYPERVMKTKWCEVTTTIITGR